MNLFRISLVIGDIRREIAIDEVGRQLYKKYKLNDDENLFTKEAVEEMRWDQKELMPHYFLIKIVVE